MVYRIVALTLATLAGIALAAGPVGRSSEPPASSRYVDTHMHLDGMLRGGGASATGRGERKRPSRTRRDEMKGRSASNTSATRSDYETAGDNLVSLMDQYGVAFALIMPPPQNPDQRGSYDYRALLPAVQKPPETRSCRGRRNTESLDPRDGFFASDQRRSETVREAGEVASCGRRQGLRRVNGASSVHERNPPLCCVSARSSSVPPACRHRGSAPSSHRHAHGGCHRGITDATGVTSIMLLQPAYDPGHDSSFRASSSSQP